MLDNMSNTEFMLWCITIGSLICYIGSMIGAHFDRKHREKNAIQE